MFDVDYVFCTGCCGDRSGEVGGEAGLLEPTEPGKAGLDISERGMGRDSMRY